MPDRRELPILLLLVSCFDRRREKPFPVYNLGYYLDCDQLAPEHAAEILGFLEAKGRLDSSPKPTGFDETVITFSIGPRSVERQVLDKTQDQILKKYRNRFVPIPANDGAAFCRDPIRSHRPFQTVHFAKEYFEDENGTPISKYEMIKHVSGHEFPIIVGDPGSVLRLEAVAAANSNEWTVQKARTCFKTASR